MLSIIAAIGKHRELGKDNKLLWHIPGDLQRFKQLTMHHPIIMGRKTFESLPGVLAGRTNIVISSNSGHKAEGATVVGSLDAAIEVAKQSPGAEETFIIGGGQIYAQAIDRADRLYLTVVDRTAEADTFFPDYSNFTNIIEKEDHTVEGFCFTYLTLGRVPS